jgi:DNA polymerase
MATYELLSVIESEVKACERCPELCASRKNTVFADGNPHARIVLVGEAPGKNEDDQGVPFVGQAGQLLDNILAAMGLSRSKHVYVLNTVKCRPPGNRVPTAEEKANCREYLDRQIKAVDPAWIVCLGSTASQSILGQNVEAVRGQVVESEGRKVLATYHPAAILWENDSEKQKAKKLAVWSDLAPLRAWLSEKNP